MSLFSSSLVLLFMFLLISMLAAVLLFLVRKKPERIYKPKGPYLLSAGEKRFYDALSTTLQGSPYLIFAKVRIADLIETKLERTDPNFWKVQGPMNQKHIDFILVDRADTRPLLAIELDGGSHQDSERANRDAFVNSVFQSAGIPMLHIPARGFYQYTDLRRVIEQSLASDDERLANEPQK